MFTNEQIYIASLPKFENLELQPIDSKYFYILLLNVFVSYSSVLITLLAIKYFIDVDFAQSVFWYAFAGVFFLGCVTILFLKLGFKKRLYALREKDIIYSSGYLYNSTTTLPFNRIQHLEISRSFLARKLGLSTLKIYSAGESGGDISIAGLPKAVADAQYAFLTAIVNERD